MSRRLVTLSEQADRWLGRHRWVSYLKIANIARYKQGKVTEIKDKKLLIETNVNNNGKPVPIFIKIEEKEDANLDTYIEVHVIKLHAGHLNNKEEF